MCGRFANDIPVDELVEYYSAVVNGELPDPSWNIAPAGRITTVLDGRDGLRHIAPAQWNLIPTWSRTPQLTYPTHNARIESILDKKTFSHSAETQRCIIPASGYYEWDAKKHPHYFTNPDAVPLSIAGLFTWWRAHEHEAWVLTATILTREAAGAAAAVHHRMPVLIATEMIQPWLDRDTKAQDIIPLASAKGADASARLSSWQVKALKGDGKGLTVPDDSQNQPLLSPENDD
ncbi:MAG: SOS response-associated peptidase [Bifidobacterium crudilactis]|jgi:putative SOS response-associated peptidase YedK|uniref:SOS response-associated peptidase n=1 Tax=Bifidobacterium crudilactis TaxID=327277 RepID=UPI0023535E07|nr:SOS response-associated peptidase [Bifidobacterium crudilactis]MCI1218308.1 SOS response-associated peptidase [Bifidobacterium crudilactis]MCI1636761.1 SOS response-associated peptidase [Bifidobacterium crudilactis]